MSDDDASLANLTRILARAGDDARSLDLHVRLQWLEDAALAVASCDLGERGARGALDLKAALGAILRYARANASARASSGRDVDDGVALDQLEAVVRVLVARGTSSIYAALADAWEDLVDEGPMRAQAKLLADAFRALSTSIARGEDPSPAAFARIAEVAASLTSPA